MTETDVLTEYDQRPPWGRDAHTALRWAFNLMERSTISPNLIAQMRTGSKPKSELSPLELRAQAAVIREVTIRLEDRAAGSFLIAYYLPRPRFVRQPGGQPREMIDVWANERAPAIQAIAWWLMGQAGTGQHRIRGYQELVAQYVLGHGSIRRARALLKCSQEKAVAMTQESTTKLQDLKARAITMAQGRLEQDGLL